MPTLDQVKDNLFVMIKGEPGLRKSSQALGFPGPQYWLSFDRKMSGIMIPAKLWGIDTKTITFDDFDDWNKPKAKLESLIFNCPYKTIVVDSLTTMADVVLRQTLKVKAGELKKSGAAAGRMVGGIVVNEMEDYNAETSAFNELLSLLKEISGMHGVNVVLIAHVMEVQNKNISGQTTVVRTIVTAGKRVAAKVPALCTEVWHFNRKSSMVMGEPGSFLCITETNGDDFARTSIGLPASFEFKDQPIYKTHVLPALEKLKG